MDYTQTFLNYFDLLFISFGNTLTFLKKDQKKNIFQKSPTINKGICI